MATEQNVSKLNTLIKKWDTVLEHPELPKIKDRYRKGVTAQMFENTVAELSKAGPNGVSMTLLGESAPTNSMGSSSSTASAGSIDTFDPVLISMLRRSLPNLIAYDVCAVQPMTGPVGLVFAMRSRYTSQTGGEALFFEADASFSRSYAGNTASQGAANSSAGAVTTGTDPTQRSATSTGGAYNVHTGMTRAQAEALGTGTGLMFNEMAFSIEKISVTAVSRALKAEYSTELAQDLKAVHGMDAETELSNILSSEILTEINREVVRTINYSAVPGAQKNVTTTGTFDLDTDSNGRWMVEKFKGLMFQIERDANELAKATRRGKGNIMITSSDVASALNAAGVLDYTPALANNLEVDDTGNTFAGILNGRIKVYIDPYFSSSSGLNYYTMGYKGTSAFDAGLMYCPYVPMQLMRAVGENSFIPKIAFKTRYGIVSNPYATADANGTALRLGTGDGNKYYRLVCVKNLM